MKRFETLTLLSSALVFLSISCGPIQRQFYVNALDTQETEISCVILVNDEILPSAEEPFLTPHTIDLTFNKKRDGSDYESIKLDVRAVELDSDGKIVRGIREGEASPYLGEPRYLYCNDAGKQLFFLRKNPDF
jgi:hypothetical protein